MVNHNQNPMSGFFDTMIRLGLPHYDKTEQTGTHCWCKPTIITVCMDTSKQEDNTLELVFHNYEMPLEDDEIHKMFWYALIADKMFDQDDNDDQAT